MRQADRHDNAGKTGSADRLARSINFTDNPDEACLLVPTVQVDCFENKCGDPRADDDSNLRDTTARAALEPLPHWDGGRNHIVFTTSDFERPAVGLEIRAHAGMSLAEYRRCHDVSFPTFNIREYLRHDHTSQRHGAGPAALAPPEAPRKFFLTFKGSRYPFRGPKGDWCPADVRDGLDQLHDPDAGAVVLTRCKSWGLPVPEDKAQGCRESEAQFATHDYGSLMNSTFGLAPRGCGPSSYRLLELLNAGVIPIIQQDGVMPPFAEWMDWNLFSVLVPEAATLEIPGVLRSIGAAKVKAMQHIGRNTYRRHLASPEQIILSTLFTLKRRLRRAHKLRPDDLF